MLPILPKILLWRDKENITEFFDLDDVNEDFYEVLGEIENRPHLGRIDEVELFNEVYHLATRMVYEHPMPNEIREYVAEIKANLGWKFGAELVLTMVFYLLQLQNKSEHPINQFSFNAIRDICYSSIYWRPFKNCYEKLKKEERVLKYNFKPCPNSPMDMRYKYYIDWNEVTQNYELSCIEHVLNLWEEINDKFVVARWIEDSLIVMVKKSDYDLKREQIHRFFLNYFNGYHYKEDIAKEKANQNSIVAAKDKEIGKFKTRIDVLEMANHGLKASIDAMIPDEKEETRSFTLKEIVEYCKSCIEWNDAKSVVAMLNKKLRTDGTEEESKLVDSVEDHFKQRLGVGLSIKEALIEVNSPGNIVGKEIKM